MTNHPVMDESGEQAISVAIRREASASPCQRVVDGRQLRAVRAILGISMQEMADMAQVHKNTVYALEGQGRLKRRAFAADRIASAAEGYGVRCLVVGGMPTVEFDRP